MAGFGAKRMIDVYVASAFCKNNSGGNKAGVVLTGENLTPVQKLNIAKKLGYSETAFMSSSGLADFKLDYFTKTEEVPLCGHATIAAFSILQKLNMLSKANYTIETKAGILHIQINTDGLIFMEQKCPAYFDVLEPALFSACIGQCHIDKKLPIQIVSTGMRDIMLPVKTIRDLKELQPDFKAIKELSKEKDVIGIHAFTIIEEDGITAICRNFAPLYGINEESATGTSNCALACYLFRHYKKKAQYVFTQGHKLGEVSKLAVKIVYHGEVIDSVFVGGYGYLVCKKTVQIQS
ncbi:MAG: PhzF family phenazine biosynthesis protein [Lachnospiraceae bacterium]|nr:PhzF family phenazine biosynthesis protein [Lachnospiraceae bacterium]